MGYTHASGSAGRDPFTSKVVDSLFVGETENIGNPTDCRRKRLTAAACRSPQCRTFPIRGYEYYDYRHDVVNVTFVNFRGQRHSQDGALSYLMYTSAGVSTENSYRGARNSSTPSRCISRRWSASGATTI
jgi:cell migration-inducing and hyaluronan-binding protein